MATLHDNICSECDETFQAYKHQTRPSACGKAACLGAETERHNANVATVRAERAATPRAPRVKREPVALYGDVAWIAAMNGIRTDGTGRKA